MEDRLYKCLQFGLVGGSSCLNVFWTTNLALAQQSNIIPDNTLGAESSRLNRNIQINGINADSIDGGALREGSTSKAGDRNLFHSFSEFNINDGQAVYFANPDGIQNILTRVTGGNASNIFGTLGVDGAANLFLINPSGIVFGENASLDLQGSFVGTTASGIQFGEQGNFSATNPETPGNLTVNPSALFFNQVQASGGIINQFQGNARINPNGDQTTGLRVPDGKSLLLVGGDINLDGGSLRAYEGNIELASVAAPGSVALDIAGNTFGLNIAEDLERGDVSLANQSYISVFGAGGGNLVINARNLEISNSFIFAGISQNSENPDAQAGDVTLNATGFIELTDGAGIDNSVYSQGNAGNIKINSGEQIIFDGVGSNGPSGAFSTVESNGVGNAGDIDLTTDTLSVSNGAQIKASTLGKGNGGKIDINASESVTLSGVNPTGVRSTIETSAKPEASGNTGDINVTTNKFRITDSARVTASTGNNHKAGNINVNANSFEAFNGGRVIAPTVGSGNAGTINLNVKERVTLSGRPQNVPSGLFAGTSAESTGKGGSIFINPRLVIIENGAAAWVGSNGTGDAGDIFLQAGTVQLDNGSISARTLNTQGGNINLELSEKLVLRNNSQITTTAGNQQFGGDGGNIDINSKFIVVIPEENSDITANAFSGAGGKVNITTGGIFGIEPRLKQTNKSDITASSQQSISGETNINAADTSSIQNSFTEISPNIDTDAIIANSCIVRGNKRQENSFIITGTGGLRNSPGDELISIYSTGEVRNVEFKNQSWKKGDPIIEPQGLYRLSNGELLLSRECNS